MTSYIKEIEGFSDIDVLEFYLETPAQLQILVLLMSLTRGEQCTLYQNKRDIYKP